MTLKYIVVQCYDEKNPFVFPPYIEHYRFALRAMEMLRSELKCRDTDLTVTSAGFVKFSDSTVTTFGESASLRLKSLPEDATLIMDYKR